MRPRTERKIVLVTRPSRLTELIARHLTREQARFHLEHLGADFSDYQREHDRYGEAQSEAVRLLGNWGRVHVVDRRFLPNYLFGPTDVVVAMGQDGLVANVLKYLHGQPLIGVNPDPVRWEGVLLPFQVGDLMSLLPEVLCGRRALREVTMAQATVNRTQVLYAVNDLFLGVRGHGSARYRLRLGEQSETQSSSGVVVSTGLGSTGWFQSLITGAAQVSQLATKAARAPVAPATGAPALADAEKPAAPWRFDWDARHLFYTVREPFPSRHTGCRMVFGRIEAGLPLVLESQMAEHGLIFSDGLEHDALEFNAGSRVEVSVAERRGRLVV